MLQVKEIFPLVIFIVYIFSKFQTNYFICLFPLLIEREDVTLIFEWLKQIFLEEIIHVKPLQVRLLNFLWISQGSSWKKRPIS